MAHDMGETTITARIAGGSQSSYARFAGLMYFFTVFDVTGVVIVSRISGSGSSSSIPTRFSRSNDLASGRATRQFRGVASEALRSELETLAHRQVRRERVGQVADR